MIAFRVPRIFPNKTIFWLAFWICIVNTLVVFEEYPTIPAVDQSFYLWTRNAVMIFMYVANLGLAMKPLSLPWQYLFGLSSYFYCFHGEYFRPNYVFAYIMYIILQALFVQQPRRHFFTFHIVGSVGFAWWIGENLEKNRIRLQTTDLLADYQTNIAVCLIVVYILFTKINQARVEKDRAQSQFLLVGKQSVNIIHDLKSLASAPQIYLDHLLEKNQSLEPELQNILQHLKDDLTNMVQKTKDLYKMVQLRGQDSNLESINTCLNRSLSFLSTRLQGTKVIRMGDESQLIDPMALELIFLNLFYNSLAAFKRHQIQEPTVKIEVLDRAIIVHDNGGGAAEELHRKFNTDSLQGSGLGLFLIRDAAEAAGYTVSMQNSPLNGQMGLRVSITYGK